MSFFHWSLLGGVAAVGIPVVLHLLLRPRPKRIVFPALQLVRERRETNRRSLRLRHWILLILRMLAVGLLALALARPSAVSAVAGQWGLAALAAAGALGIGLLLAISLLQRRSRWVVGGLTAGVALLAVATLALTASALGRGGWSAASREAPVAAILVIDTAPHMAYRHANRTRLEEARELAEWLLGQFPPDSRIAVLQSRSGQAVFSADRSAARKAIGQLEITHVPQSLTQLLQSSLDLLDTSGLTRREIYVLTDLSEQSWSRSESDLEARLDAQPEVGLYLLDVGVEEPSNFSLGDVRLSSEKVSRNGEVEIEVEVRALGQGGERTLEVYLEEVDLRRPFLRDGELIVPESRKRSQEIVSLGPGDSRVVRFRVRTVERGTRHGFIRLAGEDNLALDDIRYFTVEVREASPVLVAAPDGVVTISFTEALAPYQLRAADEAPFRCEVVPQTALAGEPLESFQAVCLLDPRPLSATTWRRLYAYVESGGGLAVFLGHHARDTEAFVSEEALELLPGRLGSEFRAGQPLFLSPGRYDHPILAPFRPVATSVPWDRFPVFRHWGILDLPPDAATVLRYGNGEPAIVERLVGRGRVVLMTTPITEPVSLRQRRPWNELAGSDDWPRFILVNSLVEYLVNSGSERLNETAGNTVVLSNHPDRDPPRYDLFTPRRETLPVRPADDRLVVRATESPGIYRLKGNRGGPVSRGFSVNAPASATELARVSRATLDESLGKGRYRLARNREQIEREQGTQRAGQEFYPFLVLLVALVLALEHLLANRFYRANRRAVAPGSRPVPSRPSPGGTRIAS